MSEKEDLKAELATEPTQEPTVEKKDAADDEDDLDDLLDEFDEQILSKPPGSTVTATNADSANESQGTSTTKKPSEAPQEDDFQINMEELIKDLNIEDPKAKEEFEHLVKQFENTHRADAKKAMEPQNFDNVVKDTMERLKKQGETIDEQLKNDPTSSNPEDMLTQLLAGMGGGADGDFDMSKLLTDMLEQLSSKDVLYEPIKDLNTKFPEFLKEQKGKISEEDHTRYTKQYEITNDIMNLFESSDFDNESLQKREEVNKLLESLQELGNPPTELVGDAKDFPGLGDLGALGGEGLDGLDFDSKDLPKDFEKELEEGCKQQ